MILHGNCSFIAFAQGFLGGEIRSFAVLGGKIPPGRAFGGANPPPFPQTEAFLGPRPKYLPKTPPFGGTGGGMWGISRGNTTFLFDSVRFCSILVDYAGEVGERGGKRGERGGTAGANNPLHLQ